MQWRGSTNKFPTKLNVAEIKFDTVISLWMGKTTKAKTPPGDFKVTTPKNPLINNQAITNIRNLTNHPDLSRNINLQLNLHSNTQLDLIL